MVSKTKDTMSRVIRSFFFMLLVSMVTAPDSDAKSSFWTGRGCVDCHGGVPVSCDGCHKHGNKNLVAATDYDTYLSGDTVNVTLEGGSKGGWVRAILYDENDNEIAISSAGTGGGEPFPITLSVPAPPPGIYIYSAAYFGNNNGSGHAEKAVPTNSFEVAAATVCGDGVVEGAEDCDPMEPNPGGCCAGDCSFKPGTSPCNNLNACDGPDQCDGGGNCVSVGPVLDCDDLDECTSDSCDPGIGCQHTNNTNPCDDSNACTASDQCSGGSCQSGSAVNCNDGNICTDDFCDPGSGCVNTHNTASCDDGDSCTINDGCSNGSCSGTSLSGSEGPYGDGTCLDECDNDGDGKTDSADSDCVPACTINADCDDGLYCNGVETCDVGGSNQCRSGTLVVCNDGQYCNGTEICNEAIDSCESGTFVTCTDGQYCNGIEACNEATNSCDAGTPITCDDSQYCNGIETCNEATDSCGAGTPIDCDDGQYCNGTEACNENTDSCDPGAYIICDDGNGCTDDNCSETIDSCDFIPNDSNCLDDGVFCNGAEFCDTINGCASSGDPCSGNGTICDEDMDLCYRPDSDSDGVPDDEDDAPLDNTVGSPFSATDTGKLKLDVSGTPGAFLSVIQCLLENDASLIHDNIPDGFDFPDGLVMFEVTVPNPGDTVDVAITWPSEIPDDSRYYMVDTSGFHRFRDIAINGNTITLTLTDGGRWDLDEQINGVILDPGGVAAPLAAAVPISSGGGGSGCTLSRSGGNSLEGLESFSLLLFPILWLAVMRRKRV